MSWRALPYIILLVLISVFIALNLKNVSDVSFGFVVLEAVPVFLTVLVSFSAGMAIAIPMILIGRPTKKIRSSTNQGPEADPPALETRRRSRRSAKNPATSADKGADFGVD